MHYRGHFLQRVQLMVMQGITQAYSINIMVEGFQDNILRVAFTDTYQFSLMYYFQTHIASFMKIYTDNKSLKILSRTK